jgi:hypothetical protein
MTVIEAVIQVMRERGTPMSPAEVYAGIEQAKLYVFRAKDPSNVVRTQMRRHSADCPAGAAARVAYLERVSRDVYALLPQPQQR